MHEHVAKWNYNIYTQYTETTKMHYKATKSTDFVKQLNASQIVGISSMQMLY